MVLVTKLVTQQNLFLLKSVS